MRIDIADATRENLYAMWAAAGYTSNFSAMASTWTDQKIRGHYIGQVTGIGIDEYWTSTMTIGSSIGWTEINTLRELVLVQDGVEYVVDGFDSIGGIERDYDGEHVVHRIEVSLKVKEQ